MLEIIGRVHPLIIHIPIGIFIWALLVRFVFKSNDESTHTLQNKILPTVLYSSICTVLSGLAHAASTESESDLTNYHKIAGILFTLSIGYLIYSYKKASKDSTLYFPWFLSTALLFITGDLGAKLTHGYNLFSMGTTVSNSNTLPITKTGIVYDDIIAPILRAKCYSCHSSTKHKGNLRLDSRDHIMKGGKHGPIIDTIHPEKSELLKRLFLPIDEEDHMPPSGKSQLSETDQKLIEWWVMQGSNFNIKISELAEEERNTLGIDEMYAGANKTIDKFQTINPGKLDIAAIHSLSNKGYVLSPLAQGSNLVQARLRKPIATEDTLWWNKIAPHIVVLTIHDSILDIHQARYISRCTNLVELDVSNSNISDTLLGVLHNLHAIQLLNITNTSVSLDGLHKFGSKPSLTQLFLFNTSKFEISSLTSLFPNVKIDTGNYVVPFLPGDTSFFTRTIYLKMLVEDSLKQKISN